MLENPRLARRAKIRSEIARKQADDLKRYRADLYAPKPKQGHRAWRGVSPSKAGRSSRFQ